MGKANFKGLRSETKSFIDGEENLNVEFKSSINGLAPEDFVALTNGKGGTILLGVEERRKGSRRLGNLCGCKVGDRQKQAIISKANACIPRVNIIISEENTSTNKPIYRIDIPEGEQKPYCTSGGIYKIRLDGQNVGIDPNIMKAIIIEKEEKEFLARFQAAGSQILKRLEEVEQLFSKQTRILESLILETKEISETAASAAQEALDAAQAAADAADRIETEGY